MADLFAFPDANWRLPLSNEQNRGQTPDPGRREDQLESSRPLDSQNIGNVFYPGFRPSLAPSNVHHNTLPSHTPTNPMDQSSQDNFDQSFHASPKNDLAFAWCREGRSIVQDVNSIATHNVEYMDPNFEIFGADMELGHDYLPESSQSNIISTYHNGQYLSQPIRHPPSTSTSFSYTLHQPVSGLALNICTVQPTPNPRVFVFRCTFPRCRAKTFRRWADFHRHYNGAHASEKTVFWCPVEQCSRSESRGHRGFPRKDKMMVHVEKMHGVEDRDGGAIFG